MVSEEQMDEVREDDLGAIVVFENMGLETNDILKIDNTICNSAGRPTYELNRVVSLRRVSHDSASRTTGRAS